MERDTVVKCHLYPTPSVYPTITPTSVHITHKHHTCVNYKQNLHICTHHKCTYTYTHTHTHTHTQGLIPWAEVAAKLGNRTDNMCARRWKQLSSTAEVMTQYSKRVKQGALRPHTITKTTKHKRTAIVPEVRGGLGEGMMSWDWKVRNGW